MMKIACLMICQKLKCYDSQSYEKKHYKKYRNFFMGQVVWLHVGCIRKQLSLQLIRGLL